MNSTQWDEWEEIFIGTIDAITKAYIRRNEVFADAFNYFIYDGVQVIQPEQLKELDPTEIALLYNDNNTKGKNNTGKRAVQKYRDHLKSVALMADNKTAYILLGIENQTDIHYAMPVRNMLYDALQYAGQVDDIANFHRNHKKQSVHQPSTHAEFLSGFQKNDKLIPVITLVMFFNARTWDGPRSLMDMMDISDPLIKKLVVDYPLYLISPKQITDDGLKKFHSSLREVMGCIKYSADKTKLAAFINDNPGMKQLETAAARVIESVNHIPIKIEKGDETVNMCQAIEEMIQDGREEGQERINQLNIQLSKQNRTDDILKAATNKKYQEQLLKEFNL